MLFPCPLHARSTYSVCFFHIYQMIGIHTVFLLGSSTHLPLPVWCAKSTNWSLASIGCAGVVSPCAVPAYGLIASCLFSVWACVQSAMSIWFPRVIEGSGLVTSDDLCASVCPLSPFYCTVPAVSSMMLSFLRSNSHAGLVPLSSQGSWIVFHRLIHL
ncbi:uncharacterized protein EI90DRAFT_899535 [Cantharellus anzutake]|uniref:uncharacterized protein n=1 Tax=Cantharellus anzutake TaxID=1750568 RepID=UPI001907BE3C|nr:uncharacterized protein EI90DRAFT_899535 [Cantharellus anzutake]KAF8331906.1 hypothetical protein EI90DRAFT_899535 [Cantharellus anzutake]